MNTMGFSKSPVVWFKHSEERDRSPVKLARKGWNVKGYSCGTSLGG